MKINNKAFTLTELLVALGIIGAIAAISIPSLMTRIQNRMFVTNLKSTTEAIKLLADKQLITSSTRSLRNTDFDNPTSLLSTNNFNIVSTCSSASTSCWKTTNYRTIKNTNTASVTRSTNIPTAKLKNGATLGYSKAPEAVGSLYQGSFYIDLNGDDLPNIVGRDYFTFYITTDGKIRPIPTGTLEANSTETCISGAANVCYGLIVENGWKMPY